MNSIKYILLSEYKKSTVILSLAKRSFHQQYFGSALGFFWAFIEPLLYIGILYAVFTIGLKAGSTSETPFAVYLLTGMSAWLYFAKTLNSSSNTITQYSYLLNRADFKSSHLPIINIIGNLIPHTLFVFLSAIIAWMHGFTPSIYSLQIFYYLFAMSSLLLGLSWLTASTNLFVKDISKIASLITLFGFWLTPIFWNITMVPESYQWIVKLNPVFYIVRGYRESLVDKIAFWEHFTDTFYFWSVTALILYAGITVFKKLEPHFGDVI